MYALHNAGKVDHAFRVGDTIIWKRKFFRPFDTCVDGQFVVNVTVFDPLKRDHFECVGPPVNGVYVATVVYVWCCVAGLGLRVQRGELRSLSGTYDESCKTQTDNMSPRS